MELEKSEDECLLRVSSTTNVGKLAGSIYASYKENETAIIIMRTIGAGALNQGIKGVILANKQFSKIGLAATCLPYFKSFESDGENGRDMTAIEMILKIKRV